LIKNTQIFILIFWLSIHTLNAQYLTRNLHQFVAFDSIPIGFNFDVVTLDDITVDIGDDYVLDSIFKHKKDKNNLYTDVYINEEKTLRSIRISYESRGIELYFSPKQNYITSVILRENFQGSLRSKLSIGSSSVQEVIEAHGVNSNWKKLLLDKLKPTLYLDYNQIGFIVKGKLKSLEDAVVTGVVIKNKRRLQSSDETCRVNDYLDFEKQLEKQDLDLLQIELTINERTREQLHDTFNIDWEVTKTVTAFDLLDSLMLFTYDINDALLKLLKNQYIRIDRRGEETIQSNLRDSLLEGMAVTSDLIKLEYLKEFSSFFKRRVRLVELRNRDDMFQYSFIYVDDYMNLERRRFIINPDSGEFRVINSDQNK